MARCRERAPEDENLTDKELARKIRQVDAARAKTQEMISDFKWGDKKWYQYQRASDPGDGCAGGGVCETLV